MLMLLALMTSWIPEPVSLTSAKCEEHLLVQWGMFLLALLFQKDSILPKETPDVFLIEALILRLGQAFSQLQLGQVFQRITLLYKCFYSSC